MTAAAPCSLVSRYVSTTPGAPSQPCPGVLGARPALDDLAAVGGHREAALVAEEVGGVEQEDVQHVALDPLAAVEEPAKVAEPSRDLDTERVVVTSTTRPRRKPTQTRA